MKIRNVLTALVAATTFAIPTFSTISAASTEVRSKQGPATVVTVAASKRVSAFDYALKQKGEPYRYGGSGPSSWDCSGLVFKSYGAAGISLPRVSGAQRSSSKTVHVSRYKAQRGDLAFWGSGHVEFVVKVYKKNGKWYTQTYGAHHSGTVVSYRTNSGVPHIEHVKGAG
jgi:cell wall-associated NlpC family hydrolase